MSQGKSFVHLHNHTEYSMLDGMGQVKSLFAEAARLEMPALGMTDHGNMYCSPEFYRESLKYDVKPIIGLEGYVAPGSRFATKRELWGEPHQKSDDVSASGAYTHITMLAENATGLRNIFKMSSLASIESQFGKWPRMDADLIAQYSSGVIGTTGCPTGEVQTRLRLGHHKEAYEAAEKWQSIFGKDNYFLELMDHDIEIEHRVRHDLIKLGKDLKIPPLVTNDSHYVSQEQAAFHDAMLCIQTGSMLNDPNAFKFDGDGYYLKTAEEMRKKWDVEVPGACDATLLIAERVQSYAELWEQRDLMPIFPVPEGETQASWLRKEVMKGLQWRFPAGVTQDYIDRADFELDVIEQKGFPAYFLVVGDLVAHARSVGIRVGPGRGSAAGALVAYALAITNIDPLEHGLLFERFLNPERPSAPDIDIDFDDRRRGEMIRYATDKWGEDKVAQVVTFGTIKTKAALKDAARVHYGQPGFQIADRISKALPPAVGAVDIPLSGILDTEHERYPEANEVRELIEQDPDAKRIYHTARGIEGLIRNTGVHACAVIMSSEPLMDSIPMWKRKQDGAIITGWDYPSCEEIGLLKMDFLGLRNLTVIGDCVENIRLNRGVEINLDTLALDDAPTFELLGSGNTLGVFQLDSGGMQELLKRMKPTGFNDIVAALALYRPGPMGVGTHWNYADRKNGRQKITPIHPELETALEDILQETYGLIVYQEQIMTISRKLANYTAGEADAFRKAMGKKKKEVLAAEFKKFSAGMSSNGFSAASIKTLWDTIEPFAAYAFNKSHAAGYGLVSYWTAYLKRNYEAEYMAGLLTSVSDDKDKSAQYLSNCRQMGINVLPPDVNESLLNYATVGEDIRFGLGAIRNVGSQVVESIIRSRTDKGRFEDFSDYIHKIESQACSKKVTESLIKAGAFDSLNHPRKGLQLIHADAVDSSMQTKKAEAVGQYDLFGGGETDDGGSNAFGFTVPDQEWVQKQKLAFEREMLGLYVSGHPLDGMREVLQARTDTTVADIQEGNVKGDANIVLGGIISGVDRRVNKHGLPWAIVRLEDFTGGVDILFFHQTYPLVSEFLVEDSVVLVKARTKEREDRLSIFGDVVLVPDTSTTGSGEKLYLKLPATAITRERIESLTSVLRQHPGELAVEMEVLIGNDSRRYALNGVPAVAATSSLKGDLKALFGPDCVS